MEKHAKRPWGSKVDPNNRSATFGSVAPMNYGSAAFDGLPEPFIAGLRTLFDVMDDQSTGYIRLSDIELRWREDEDSGAPKGVIECLKKVSPANGLLSFERFCAGLKICLLRNRAQKQTHTRTASVPPVRPPSAPVLDLERDECSSSTRDAMTTKGRKGKIVNMATVRPNNVSASQQQQEPQQLRSAVSMPHLNEDLDGAAERDAVGRPATTKQQLAEPQAPNPKAAATAVPLGVLGPPKPPRVINASDPKSSTARSDIRAALHCWHMGMLHSDSESVKSGSDFELSAIAESATRKDRGRETRLSANSVSLNNLSWEAEPFSIGGGEVDRGGGGTIVSYLQAGLEVGGPLRRSTNRRREPRRHTLQSGIDYNMLKRLKQVEQEREMIVVGLQTLEKARDWYLGQLSIVEEKMRDVGRNGQLWEHSSEAYQERLNFQRARISEVNQHLLALIESSEKGFPLHMNLALRLPNDASGGGGGHSQVALNSAHSQLQINNRSIFRLKDQNRQLTEEVGKKTERITALEREKAVLIRELFQARSMLRGSGGVGGASFAYQPQPQQVPPLPLLHRPAAPQPPHPPVHQLSAPLPSTSSSSPHLGAGLMPQTSSIKGGHRRATDESAFL